MTTFRMDDPDFARYLRGRMQRDSGHESVEEKQDMAERATEDEVITLEDGRRIQIQAKGAPVNKELADRERELVNRSVKAAKDVDHFAEIQPDDETKALGSNVKRIVDDKGAPEKKK